MSRRDDARAYDTEPLDRPRRRRPAHGRAAGLPFRGPRGRRNSIRATVTLLLAGAVTAAVNPIAAVLLVSAAYVCVMLYLAWQQGPLWATAVAALVGVVAAAAFTFAQTTAGQQPARTVAFSLSDTLGAGGGKLRTEARDCLTRFVANAADEPGCLWGRDTHAKPPKVPAGAGEPARRPR